MVGKFRKKPVVIDAIQLPTQPDHNAVDEVLDFLKGTDVQSNGDGSLTIPTLEGAHRADPGDWIIKGIKGEFYPCKPDIFDATYEPA